MPLVPFKLSNGETRLIVHNDCLYKLKLSNKSEISLKGTSSSRVDKMNTELTKVIRAILFLIKAEKDIPPKIHTPCFTACVAVKFWKIALKLGFSKNGSRLKCGHLIELMLKERRIQEKEYSEANTESPLKSIVGNKIIQKLGQFVMGSGNSETETSCSEEESESVLTINDKTVYESSEHSKSAENENTTVSTDIDGPTENQTEPSDQTPVISDHAQINFDPAQTLNEHPHVSYPSKETTPVEVLPTFVTSCTQTNPDELDNVPNPDSDSENPCESVCHSVHSVHSVHSDHDYLKSQNSDQAESKLAVSNSNNESTPLQEKDASDANHKQSSAIILNSSEDGENEDSASNVRDVGEEIVLVSSGPKEVSSPAAAAVNEVTIETLNAEPKEPSCVGSLANKSGANCQDQNDVWGIVGRPHEVVSEVELPMESHSESSQDDLVGNGNHKPLRRSERTAIANRENPPEAHHSGGRAVQEGNSSETEITESSPEKLQSGPSQKQVKPKDKSSISAPRDQTRARSLRSHRKVENVRDNKLRSVKMLRKSPPKEEASTSREKKDLDLQTPGKHKRTKQQSGIPQDPSDISFGLHDRYQVQTQDLQEDLKLQDFAQLGSSLSPKKKTRRSFMEYLNFPSFLRRSTRPK